VIVPATQQQIDALADRIERAYRLRRAGWHGNFSTARVWSSAAVVLLRVHEADVDVPPDPELFVASQPLDGCFPDPWRELTQESAALHYRKQVRSIVRALRAEVRREIRTAERCVEAGEPLARVLNDRKRGLSPMGRYIAARRAGRLSLARRYLGAAVEQHRCCPLYRQACAGLIPAEAYPSAGVAGLSRKSLAGFGLPVPAHLN
jgi:hypothetical protein